MAEAVLSFVVEQTLARTLTLATGEIKLLWGLGGEIDRLRDSLDQVRDMLQLAEEQQVKLKSVNRWLNQLKDAAYDAEDALDELVYEDLRCKVSRFSPLSSAKKAAFHIKISHKVKKVNELLDKIKNASGFQPQLVISRDRNVPQIDLDRVTDSVLDNPVVGRDADVSKIVDLLGCSCDQQVLTIVPIVGMGGLGKTALAKLVCQKAMTRKLFNVKMWICISDNFNNQRIFKEMLQRLRGGMGGLTSKDAILSHLEKELKGKKFLLVLDDVWDDVTNWWDGLKSLLVEINRHTAGNAIIVTTRSEKVASKVETSSEYRHNLKALSDEDCWFIIETRVHADKEVEGKRKLITTK